MTIILRTETDGRKSFPQFNTELLTVVLYPAKALGYEGPGIEFSRTRNTAAGELRLIGTIKLNASETLDLDLVGGSDDPDYPAGLDTSARPLFRMLVNRYHQALENGAERDHLARALIPRTTVDGFRCIGEREESVDALPAKRGWRSARVRNFALDDCAFHLEDARVIRLSDATDRALNLEITQQEITEDTHALQHKVYGLSASAELEVLLRLRDTLNTAIAQLGTTREQGHEGREPGGDSNLAKPIRSTRRRKQI